MTFDEFRKSTGPSTGLRAGALTTDDLLAAMLPLFRQVEAIHRSGRVAPLDGVDRLFANADGRLHVEDADAGPPRLAEARVREVEAQTARSLEIVGQHIYTADMAGGEDHRDLLVTDAAEGEGRAVYLPGYRSWEHLLGHHDELTDMFVLGLVLASVACGLDLGEREHLDAFAARRRNLFGIRPDLNPVVAKQIVRLTELDRHRRVQDLASVIRSLETYRDQDVGLELDLAQIPGFHESDLKGRRRMLLSRLRERLFEISRRNRLLYYKPTLQSVNLTFASIPILFDVRNIRPEQIFTWQPGIERLLADGKPISLNKYLRFEDAPYLPNVLDKVMAEARRDAAEFGFSQLRLVICFLRWTNLKEDKDERIDSPLLLLPIELTKKKGIRDSYVLTATSGEAEVNPVLRYFLKQLYDINLPFSVDLNETTITAFYDALVAQIHASEPGVTLNRIDKPQVELVYARARRRLDQYKRRLRLGVSFKTFGQFDYSYNRENYQPLGLRLFSSVVRPSPAPLQDIFRDSRTHEARMTGTATPPPPDAGEKQKVMAAFREGASDGNPYVWDFDLCNLTLGNFNYRKMSLIRDYNMLLERERPSVTFDAVFPLEPRPVEPVGAAGAPLAQCYPVVPCDPTQLRAIGAAQARRSYIVQGPPGTGKSQTITNLIADLVAQGKRILFVCEKRAAIDVVYHRLRQRGLHDLVCLIHDSQADKRAFIEDLKSTYERLLAEAERPPGVAVRRRTACVDALEREQQPIAAFDRLMRSVPEEAGIAVRDLIVRAIELAQQGAAAPEGIDNLPPYRLWPAHRETLDRLAGALRHAGCGGVYARHPLHGLAPIAAERNRAAAALADDLEASFRLLDRAQTVARDHGIRLRGEDTLEQIAVQVRYAATVAPLAERRALELLRPDSPLSDRLRQRLTALQTASASLEKSRQATRGWRQRLEPDDLSRALEQARGFGDSFFNFLKPGFRRLRALIRERYDFASHAVQPSPRQVLESLQAEYTAAAALEAEERTAAQEFGLTEPLATFAERVDAIRTTSRDLVREADGVTAADPVRAVTGLLAMREPLAELETVLTRVLPAPAVRSFDRIRAECTQLRRGLPRFSEWLPCLTAAGELPPELVDALRTHPLTLPQLEAAMATRTLEDIWRRDRSSARFDASQKGLHAARLEHLYAHWLSMNAETVLERHRERFLERVGLASMPSIRLTKEQDTFKRSYNAGRRELEHEFGKTMRYKPVRGLLHGDAGDVVLDLKPVWLMSPLSVSDTLPIDERIFDVAIFDEASQVPLEEAVPVLFRADQVIVSGDQMQLPPTNFFSATKTGEQTILIDDEDEDGGTVEYELDSNSFLSHAARNLPSTLLGWHYRSRSESLISFSNAAFYEGRLLTVPEREPSSPHLQPIRVASREDGDSNTARVLDRPVSFHFLEKGRYETRRNPEEAAYIARLVRGLLASPVRPTIGIVAFSEAQQGAIETALEQLAAVDPGFSPRLEEEYEREDDGQFTGLLVKNLENIQGDERDVIILSVCYGYGHDGRMLMNFGPINQSGGERRLNVAFSRAKHHMVVVSSIQCTDITNVYNDGANNLRNYLQYTAALSAGDVRAAETVLRALTPRVGPRTTEAPRDIVVEQLAAALRSRGLDVAVGLGQSRFRCDLAVRAVDEVGYRLAVFVDRGRDADDGGDIVERDVLKPRLLRSFGWAVSHVLTKDWYDDRDAVLARVERDLAGEDDDDDLAADDVIAEVEASVRATVPPPVEAPSPSPAAVPLSALPAGGTRCFEFVDGGSRKYWHVTVTGTELVVSFGRIGTQGQVKRKGFATTEGAHREAERLIREKLAKGYREVC